MESDTFFTESIIGRIKKCFLEMSDIGMQKKIWPKESENFRSAFIELINNLYYECNFYGFIDWLTNQKNDKNLIKILKTINQKLSAFLMDKRSDKSDAEILQDPNWLEIVEYAKIVTVALDNAKF